MMFDFFLNIINFNELPLFIYYISILGVFSGMFSTFFLIKFKELKLSNAFLEKNKFLFVIFWNNLFIFFIYFLMIISVWLLLFHPINGFILLEVPFRQIIISMDSTLFGFNRLLIDGLSINLMVLNSIIGLLIFYWIRGLNTTHAFAYQNALLAIQGFLNIAFMAGDVLTFFVCFEGVMFPMGLLIFSFGSQPRKARAAILFFVYTLFGSIALLMGMLLLLKHLNTLDIFDILVKFPQLAFSHQIQILILFLVGFAVKVPICPVHGWLPEAHVEAPTVGSVILAALLLKLGGFGLLRFFFPLFNITYWDLFNVEIISTNFEWIFKNFSKEFMQWVCILSAVYASLVALRQKDIKRVIAYSSIAHMNLAILAMFTLTYIGFLSSIAIMISHGLVSAALFFLVGCLYDRIGTRKLELMGGIEAVMPQFSIFFFFFTLANFGFPFTASFFGELMVLVSLLDIKNISGLSFLIILLNMFVIILTIAYSLRVYSRVCLGTLNNIKLVHDLTGTEIVCLSILLFFTLLLGFFPEIVISTYSTY